MVSRWKPQRNVGSDPGGVHHIFRGSWYGAELFLTGIQKRRDPNFGINVEFAMMAPAQNVWDTSYRALLQDIVSMFLTLGLFSRGLGLRARAVGL